MVSHLFFYQLVLLGLLWLCLMTHEAQPSDRPREGAEGTHTQHAGQADHATFQRLPALPWAHPQAPLCRL
jgi:hypothetical protein